MRYKNLNKRKLIIVRKSRLFDSFVSNVFLYLLKPFILFLLFFAYNINVANSSGFVVNVANSSGFIDVSFLKFGTVTLNEVCNEVIGRIKNNEIPGGVSAEEINNSIYSFNATNVSSKNGTKILCYNETNEENYNGGCFAVSEGSVKINRCKEDFDNTSSSYDFLKIKLNGQNEFKNDSCYVYCYYNDNNIVSNDNSKDDKEVNSNGNKYVVDGYADDIYTEAENNGLATAICKAIDIATQLMVPLFAIMFSILGLRAFQGKMELSVFFTFAIGIAAFKGAGSILEFFLPDMGLQYGCNCAVVRYVRNSDGVVKKMATGLDEDCNDIRQ